MEFASLYSDVPVHARGSPDVVEALPLTGPYDHERLVGRADLDAEFEHDSGTLVFSVRVPVYVPSHDDVATWKQRHPHPLISPALAAVDVRIVKFPRTD